MGYMQPIWQSKGKVVLGALLSTTPYKRMGSGGISPRLLNISTGWR
jgi:hypothetical protein